MNFELNVIDGFFSKKWLISLLIVNKIEKFIFYEQRFIYIYSYKKVLKIISGYLLMFTENSFKNQVTIFLKMLQLL